GQESVHGREHRVLNERLAQLGYPTKGIERFTRRGLESRERLAPPISNLAFTAALEHFTATLAELLLSSEDVRALFGHDGVRDVFLWHALEESEHKAVAFDVYRAMAAPSACGSGPCKACASASRSWWPSSWPSRWPATPPPGGGATCAAAGAGSAPRRCSAATCGTGCASTAARASTPTTSTPASCWPAGGPSCSATRGG